MHSDYAVTPNTSCNVHDVSVVLFGFCYYDLLMYAYVTTNKLVLE